MTTQAQTFQAPQNHAAFTSHSALKGKALRQSYRYHNPIVLTADQAADLAVLAAWNRIDAEMGQALPVEIMHSNPLALLTDEVDTLSLVETQIDLMGQAPNISPSCKENLIDGWLEGQASMDEVIQAHQPKVTYAQRLVRRAYSVLSFVGGYARVR